MTRSFTPIALSSSLLLSALLAGASAAMAEDCNKLKETNQIEERLRCLQKSNDELGRQVAELKEKVDGTTGAIRFGDVLQIEGQFEYTHRCLGFDGGPCGNRGQRLRVMRVPQ